MTTINNAMNKIRFFFQKLFVCQPVLIWVDFISTFLQFFFLQLFIVDHTSFLIKSYLLISGFNMSDSEKNLLKFELGISNGLVYFICRSPAEIITLSAAPQFVRCQLSKNLNNHRLFYFSIISKQEKWYSCQSSEKRVLQHHLIE
jgi:hypothetical protein